MDHKKLKEVPSEYHMMGGDGPHSYAQNSDYQRQLVVWSEGLIHELITEHLDTSFNTIRIADLGSSVGPNAFLAVRNIISAIKAKCTSTQQHVPEFHVFFNDLPDNDFNTLFRNLPRDGGYFACASPGSFHGRLFPRKTVDIAHCSTALHWLSRVPEGVGERGSVHYSGAGNEVRRAYREQYEVDMRDFLSSRAEELVPGGLMLLLVLGFPDGEVLSDSGIGVAFQILGSCLHHMAKMGKLSEDKVDSFNLPFYYPSPSELKTLIEANGLFHIERMANLGGAMRCKPDPQALTWHLRVVIEGLIEKHFGIRGSGMVMDELFRLYFQKLLKSPILVDEKYYKETNYFVCLKRKAC
ncbi:S-adenosyl-L-methionine-dependent methyltransferases superfamily protein [Striga hermonthica]|uniref:S-adenosyl-L-methionine-dependent methyltransferases superfamily protein n=1 Tax=Striga hermonthica TaxID=68872 RepID=A0A9N7NWF5_STRHE|nr:S-adenosyl-L-methionine-dependent methyltransferases superfamily protein [Striga hermonthica]